MGVLVKEMEITSSVPAAKMFKAFILDANVLYPKVIPQAFKSFEILEGNGGVGTITKVTFEEGKDSKQKVDHLDKEKFEYHYSWIEGSALMMFEKISYEIKFEDKHGGCVCKMTTKFFAAGEIQVSEEQFNAGKEMLVGIFKAIEGYVLANPEYA